jgi:septum site-determining protein MinC
MADSLNRRLDELSAILRPTLHVAPEPLPRIRIRGRSFMALVMAVDLPLARWFASLDQQMRQSAGFYADRPIVADLSALTAAEDVLAALDGLAARDLRLIGAEGVDSVLLTGERWGQLPTILHGRDVTPGDSGQDRGQAAPISPPDAGAVPSLLINGPVRSGQSVCFEDGDITVVGSVSSGAEVIAGGSIHIYGALRGRAIAGLKLGSAARIFCRRLEAEMVGVDRLYRTSEHWGPGLHGCAVQVQSDRGSLRLSAID